MIKIDNPLLPWAWLSLSVLVACAYLLVTGSPWLERRVIESSDFPFGTLISWAGLIALTSTIYLGSAKHLNGGVRLGRFCKFLLIADLVLAGSWGFVAYGLAGNWTFTFSDQVTSLRGSYRAYSVFWAYSAAIVLLALLSMTLLLVSKAFAARGGFAMESERRTVSLSTSSPKNTPRASVCRAPFDRKRMHQRPNSGSGKSPP